MGDVCGCRRRVRDIEKAHQLHPGEESVNLIKVGCVCVCGVSIEGLEEDDSLLTFVVSSCFSCQCTCKKGYN